MSTRTLRIRKPKRYDSAEDDTPVKSSKVNSKGKSANQTPEVNGSPVLKKSLRPRKEVNYHFHPSDDTQNGETDQDDSYVKYEPESSETENESSDSELFSKKKRKLNNNSVESSLIDVLQNADYVDEENEYRCQRQKNLQDRFKVLSALEFEGDVEELKKVTKIEKAMPKSNPVKKQPKTSYPKYPTKRSLRLQNRSLNLTDSVKSESNALRTELVEEESRDERIIDENLQFIDGDAKEDYSQILQNLKDDVCSPYEENNDFCSCDFDKYCEIIQSCRMRDPPIKVIQQRIVSMDFHPSQKKLILLAGDKRGNICLRELSQDNGIEFKAHGYNVNCVSFGIQDSTKFFSTSLDGTVRLGDVNNTNSQLIYTAEGGEHTTWHHEFGHSLFVAEGEGVAKLLDLRAPSHENIEFKCHKRSMRTVQLHPANENYFLTSSGSGEFGIWDIRGNPKKQEPVILETFDKALTSAFFSAKGNYVLTTGNDDTIRVFNVSDLQTAVQETKFSHNNHGGRWLSVFKARWHPQREDAFFVGSMMNNPKRIQVYRRNGKMIRELISPEMNTYNPVVIAHPTQPIIVGGNGSGRVHIFSPYSSLTDTCS